MNDCTKLVTIIENSGKEPVPNVINTAEAYMWDEDEICADLNQTRDQLDRQQKPSEYKLLSKKISKRFDQLRNEYY